VAFSPDCIPVSLNSDYRFSTRRKKPQGLKPTLLVGRFGTAEAVPSDARLYGDLSRRRVNRPAILLDRLLDAGPGFLQIVNVHGGMNLDMCIES